MANSFSRTTRSLSADRHSTTLIGLVVVLILLVMWGAWFFAAGIPILLSSVNAQVTDSQRVAVVLPLDASVGIRRGQMVNFHPGGNVGAQIGVIPGIVSRVTEDPARDLTFVEIALRFESSIAAPLQKGQKGRVDIELERVSPVRLILRSAGMLNRTNAQGPSLADN